MDYYELFQRMCKIRCVPDNKLFDYLEEFLGKSMEAKQELSKKFAEEIRESYPVRKDKIHLLQVSDFGNYPGDAQIADALKNGNLAKAEELAGENKDDIFRCPQEELEKYIEYLIEVFGWGREKTDLVDAYTLLETEADGNPDMMPYGVGVVEFTEAWNEYIEKNPVRKKVMFTWDQFTDLPESVQKTVVYCWEMEYANHKPDMTSISYDEDNEEQISRFAEMYNWLKLYGSPHARELSAGDEMLEEYRRKGSISKCPVCDGVQVLTFCYSARRKKMLTIICPKCGVIGHYFGSNEIHENADKNEICFFEDF